MPQTRSTHPDVRHTRRRWDHDAGFAMWCDGTSYAQIAKHYGVALVSVKRAAVREGWSERRHEIERKAREAADRRAVKTVAQRIEEDLRLIDAGKLAVARRLQAGQVDADLGDLVALIKTEMLLTGGASERFGVESETRRRSLDEIEGELAALPAEQVDAMLAVDAIVAERVRELPAGDPLPSQDAPSGEAA